MFWPLLFSYVISVSILLSSPKKLQAILQFILEAIDTSTEYAKRESHNLKEFPSFYLTDGNALASLLFERSIYFVAAIYLPYLILAIYLFVFSARTYAEQKLASLVTVGRVFTLIFSFIRNHFDLARSTAFWFTGNFFKDNSNNKLNSSIWTERGDFASWRSQYWGDFVDIFFLSYAWILVAVFRCFSTWPQIKVFDTEIVSQESQHTQLRNLVIYTWCFRIFVGLYVIYYFAGEGFWRDCLVLLVSFILTEVCVFLWRFLVILSSFKELGSTKKFLFFCMLRREN